MVKKTYDALDFISLWKSLKMPKPNVFNKAMTADCQTTRASATTSNGRVNNSSMSEIPPDKIHATCKELGQESVLRGINNHFDIFEAKFQTFVASQADLQACVANQELVVSDLEAHVLEAKYLELMKQNRQLQAKVLDLEAHSQRHNIKIVGIQEGEDDGKPTEFVSRLIPKLLGEEHFLHPVKVDRAHRSLQPKLVTGAKLCTILTHIHHFQVKELILRRRRL
ncbi:uncharacterized protein LOC132385137 [Hypanus sabinus]|uniref:uncharacterized protein LOC132385137 n=1 Tax=Hypanus sabinus TaxID=79690 RepID=UPI0028C50782|nr:uncharacterized protein LOC132385137 [Hypanus sabinus]XP_059812937.1 uncharacterized protein LOC132385137 [Hypanus sabinus]